MACKGACRQPGSCQSFSSHAWTQYVSRGRKFCISKSLKRRSQTLHTRSVLQRLFPELETRAAHSFIRHKMTELANQEDPIDLLISGARYGDSEDVQAALDEWKVSPDAADEQERTGSVHPSPKLNPWTSYYSFANAGWCSQLLDLRCVEIVRGFRGMHCNLASSFEMPD